MKYLEGVLNKKGIIIDVLKMDDLVETVFENYSYRDLMIVSNCILKEVVKKIDQADLESSNFERMSTVTAADFKAAAAAKPTRNKKETIEENEKFEAGDSLCNKANKIDFDTQNQIEHRPKYRETLVFLIVPIITSGLIAIVVFNEIAKE